MRIVTHSGGFHTDDVFAVAALLRLHPDAEVVRTRDPKVMATGDYVIDVGDVYDPENGRFDHHQEGYAGVRENGVPYAALGLVWKKYGDDVCGSAEVARVLSEKLIEPIDAFDNGIDLCELKISGVQPYRLEQIFFALEPTWQEENRTTDNGFKEALEVAKLVLEREIVHTRAEVDAHDVIDGVYDKTEDKRFIVFDEEHNFDRALITNILVPHKEILYFVRKHEGGLWQVVAMVDDMYSFDTRKPFPKAWGGKRGEEFADISGVADAIFCHNKRFMCIARSREGAIKLAELALESKE